MAALSPPKLSFEGIRDFFESFLLNQQSTPSQESYFLLFLKPDPKYLLDIACYRFISHWEKHHFPTARFFLCMFVSLCLCAHVWVCNEPRELYWFGVKGSVPSGKLYWKLKCFWWPNTLRVPLFSTTLPVNCM